MIEKLTFHGMPTDRTSETRAKFIGLLSEKIATKKLAIEAMRIHYKTDFGAQLADRARVIRKLEDDVIELQKLLASARGQQS